MGGTRLGQAAEGSLATSADPKFGVDLDGGVWMGRVRASSSPPSAAQRSAEAAAAVATAAAHAAVAAAAAATAAAGQSAEEGSVGTSTSAVQWPPAPNQAGLRFWFARSFPGLEDGIYTAEALENRGVDPDQSQAEGLLQGFKTEAPVLRRAHATGVERSVVYWR